MTPDPATLARAAARLAAAGVDAPRREARHLADLADSAERFGALVAARAARVPFAYLAGEQPFWSLSFRVSGATLIPRADSETLIEAAIAAFPDRLAVRRVLDLGTGTGCLLLAALTEFPAATGLGVDRSAGAAALARDNAQRLGLAGRASVLVGDWTGALRGRFDLVLCNPPYVAREELPGLMPEVAWHEPASALDGGADGLEAYRTVLGQLAAVLAPGGRAILELGHGQSDAVPAMAQAAGLAACNVQADLSGIPRALVLAAK